jgi:hypothetical protein
MSMRNENQNERDEEKQREKINWIVLKGKGINSDLWKHLCPPPNSLEP